ncbi:MAG: glutamine amidotransferase [Pirellulaceae bacterium]
MALRAILVAMLGVAMLRPTLVSTQRRPQSASLILLSDISRSMQVEDGANSRSRWDSLKQTIGESSELLQQLSDVMDVKAYAFDADVQPLELRDGKMQFGSQPQGEQTDIGSALDEVVRREMGRRIAGVILLTDGAQRAYSPKVDMQQAARELARLGYPLFTVPFGKPRDQTQARDVAVENLQDQYTVFVNNEVNIQGSLRIQGYANQPVPVSMTVTDPDGNQNSLGPLQRSATEEGQLVRFEFPLIPDKVGQYRLEVQAAVQPGELVTENNQLTAFLNVLDGGLRVLFVYGNVLGGEQQILRQSLSSSPDIQLDERPVSMLGRANWPISLESELADNYDVYLLSDVDSTALGEANSAKIVAAVAKGKGLMMTGGLYSFGPGGYFEGALEKALPVKMDRFERQSIGSEQPIRSGVHLQGDVVMLPARSHFITHLAPSDQNMSAWQRLRPLQGANKFAGVKDRAVVLAESDQGEPLLVGWRYGDGRVLAFAGDSTHYWWRFGMQEQHKRFWRQAILWLGNKDQATQQDVWINLARRRFRPGEPIEFTAGARGTDGDPIRQAILSAELVDATGKRQPLRLSPEGTDWLGRFTEMLPAGEYALEVSATFEGRDIGQTSGKFVVMEQDLELSDPAANPEQLQMLSAITSSAGGKSVAPEKLIDLLQELHNKPPETEIETESKWQLGDTNLDAWTFFLLLVGLMSSEWYLRKRWGMV